MNKDLKHEAMMRFLTRQAWRTWLEQYHQTERVLWLEFSNRSASWQGITYEEAVQEALCFKWIDSTVRRVDGESRRQRFTPRRSGSAYSQLNLERLRLLLVQHRVAEAYRAEIEALVNQEFVFAEDILDALRQSAAAWTFFQKAAPAYQRIRIAYIEASRAYPVLFQKRLQHFREQCQRQKYIGQQCLGFLEALQQ